MCRGDNEVVGFLRSVRKGAAAETRGLTSLAVARTVGISGKGPSAHCLVSVWAVISGCYLQLAMDSVVFSR